MKEFWKKIDNFTNEYEVSNLGRVKSLSRNTTAGKILKPSTSRFGYKKVTLCKNNKLTYFLVHRLVAIAFLDNPNSLPTVNHKDGDKSNNIISNLEWSTHSQQLKHGHLLGLMNHQGENHSQNKLTKNQVLMIYDLAINSNFKQHEIAKMFNVHQVTVSLIKRKKAWPHLKR